MSTAVLRHALTRPRDAAHALPRQLRMGLIWLRDETPMPARLDLAVSARRDRRHWEEAGAWRKVPLGGYGICDVCQARRLSGRAVRHAACARGLERAVKAYLGDIDRRASVA